MRGAKKRKVFAFLLPYLKANYKSQRLVTASIFAEFVNHCREDKELLEKLINCLLNSLVDPPLKFQILRGLSNIVSCGPERLDEYAATVLDALMSAVDDRDDQIAMEAMNGLSKLFQAIPEERIAPILINVCHRIRPAFDKQYVKIRKASFNLFGTLARFGEGVAASAFFEQLHANLPPLLLHLNDDDEGVSLACRSSLFKLAKLFHDEEIEHILTGRVFKNEDAHLDYEDVLNQLSKALVYILFFPTLSLFSSFSLTFN